MAYNIGRLPKLKGGQIWNQIRKSFNVFYQELSSQTESPDTRVAAS